VQTPRKTLTLLLIAVACALGALAPATLALDIGLTARTGHAALRLGVASVSVAFDFGQECSKSNGCGGAIL
jgi:hypothetical protein